MSSPQILYVSIDRLRPFPKNARTHSKKQIGQIARSIQEFGFTNPILIDGQDLILAGHGRVSAARSIGMTEVPCLRFEAMTAEQKRAYVISERQASD